MLESTRFSLAVTSMRQTARAAQALADHAFVFLAAGILVVGLAVAAILAAA